MYPCVLDFENIFLVFTRQLIHIKFLAQKKNYNK